MSQLIRNESLELLQGVTQLERQKTELQSQLEEARNELNQKTGNNNRIWQVLVKLSEPLPRATLISYDYRVRNARWVSSYSLNAKPQNNQVDWIWHAEIIQKTGIDWKDAVVRIATAEPVFTLTPPNNRPWIIQEVVPIVYRGNAKVMAQAKMADAVMMESAPALAAAPEPERIEGQLFDMYDLGRQTITSGKEARIKIRQGNWPAQFSYLARPQLTEQVFLTAELTFGDNFLPLPSGQASIQVDGVHVGQQQFSLYEKQEVSISFGSDPGVAIDVQTAHTAGEKGLLSKSETYNWNWTINVTNNKTIPVDLRVEDAYPHIAHNKITIKEQFTAPLPTKEEDGQLLVWKLKLPPQGRQSLKYGYLVTYPEDLPVSLGR